MTGKEAYEALLNHCKHKKADADQFFDQACKGSENRSEPELLRLMEISVRQKEFWDRICAVLGEEQIAKAFGELDGEG